jgi:hypothetical protein
MRFDDAPPASTALETFRSSRSGTNEWVASGATARLQRFRLQRALSRRSLTLPVASQTHERRIVRSPNRQRRRMALPSSTGRVVDASKRLRSTGACSRLSAKPQTRHRDRSFAPAIRLPTLLHPPAAVHGKARPFAGWETHRLRPLGADVACRLLPPKRSTSTTTDSPNSAEHHRRRPVGAALLRSPSLAEGLERNCRWQFSFRSTASREFTGQGFRLRTIVRASTFATAIARGSNFAPARSARTPLVASRAAHGLETSVNVEIPPGLVGSRTRSAEAHRFGR